MVGQLREGHHGALPQFPSSKAASLVFRGSFPSLSMERSKMTRADQPSHQTQLTQKRVAEAEITSNLERSGPNVEVNSDDCPSKPRRLAHPLHAAATIVVSPKKFQPGSQVSDQFFTHIATSSSCWTDDRAFATVVSIPKGRVSHHSSQDFCIERTPRQHIRMLTFSCLPQESRANPL